MSLLPKINYHPSTRPDEVKEKIDCKALKKFSRKRVTSITEAYEERTSLSPSQRKFIIGTLFFLAITAVILDRQKLKAKKCGEILRETRQALSNLKNEMALHECWKERDAFLNLPCIQARTEWDTRWREWKKQCSSDEREFSDLLSFDLAGELSKMECEHLSKEKDATEDIYNAARRSYQTACILDKPWELRESEECKRAQQQWSSLKQLSEESGRNWEQKCLL